MLPYPEPRWGTMIRTFVTGILNRFDMTVRTVKGFCVPSHRVSFPLWSHWPMQTWGSIAMCWVVGQ